MTVSLWQTSGPLSSVRTDLVIVGAGVTGLSAAIEAERRGLRCVLIDSRAPGAAASGRNAGYLMRGAADNYAAAVDSFGRETASELWRWTEQNLRDLVELGAEELPSFDRRPSCLLALADEEAGQLSRAHELLHEDGFAANLLRPGDAHTDDSVWTRASPRVGLINPDDAVVNPIELIGLLCAKLDSTELVTGCEAFAIEPSDDGGRAVHTTLGTLVASRVLVATNAHAERLLPTLRDVVRPNRGQMLAAFAPEARLDFAYYSNHGSEYFRQLEPGYIIFGGARTHDEEGERTSVDNLSTPVQSRLEELCRELIGDGFRVISRWAGIMGFSADHIPIAGEVAGDPAVWFCGGFTGHGMSMAHRTATATVRAMADDEELPGWLAIDRMGEMTV